MELRDLTYFETIAQLQHMGEAAKRLHRTQPALTASVRRLEEFCGAPLFEKAGRGIRLTPAGNVLLRRAVQLRVDIQDARREMADLGQGMTGEVKVGVVPTAAQYLLPAALQKLFRTAPGVHVKTTIGLRDGLCELLRAGELDLAVISAQRVDSEFAATRLGEDRIVVVADKRHPLLTNPEQNASTRLSELLDFDWILQPPGAPTRDWIDQAFDRRGLPRPRIRMESDMLLMLPALMAGTHLLGFVSRLHLDAARPGHGLREILVTGLTMRRQFIAACRKSKYLPPAALLLVDLLAQEGARSSP